LSGMLKLMRGPAHLAGLGELHEFLERGFNAFRGMGSASEFLDGDRQQGAEAAGQICLPAYSQSLPD
jgi:hypothetical protein